MGDIYKVKRFDTLAISCNRRVREGQKFIKLSVDWSMIKWVLHLIPNMSEGLEIVLFHHHHHVPFEMT